MKKILFGFIALSLSLASFSQEYQVKNQYKKGKTFGIHFTFHDFQTPADLQTMGLSEVLAAKQWYKTSRMNAGLALSYTQGITDHVDFMVQLGGSSLTYPLPDKPVSNNNSWLVETDASLNLKLLTDEYWVSPYISAGVGASVWNGYYGAYFPAGLGLQVNFLDEAYLILQAQYRFPVASGTTARNLFYSFGFAGNKKEVVLAPVPIPVVEPPKDSDKDGIIDSLDACPTVPGLAQFKGCPDTDKDGIQDSEDKCPTVPGLAQFQGCPDTDGDGIQDSEDKCPTVAGLARYQGCPIPDTDGDGVNDEEDKCPNVAGIADNLGCPDLKFYYKRADASLSAADKASLDRVVDFMSRNPDLFITVEGHTSTPGTTAYNQKLSEKRADNCIKYLKSKGADASKLKAIGYGEQFPVGDNTKEEGRAQSRRVVFRVNK
jgi:OmpA-OmpF porin, OOP family